jgi:hypothetical protein
MESSICSIFGRQALPALAVLLCGLATPALADDARVARGKYLVSIAGCSDCHTPGGMLGSPDMKRYLYLQPVFDEDGSDSTNVFSTSGVTSRDRFTACVEQNSMTRSTPARLYQLRSKIAKFAAGWKMPHVL